MTTKACFLHKKKEQCSTGLKHGHLGVERLLYWKSQGLFGEKLRVKVNDRGAWGDGLSVKGDSLVEKCDGLWEKEENWAEFCDGLCLKGDSRRVLGDGKVE